MTQQTDLPTISFARYLDLLKRRTGTVLLVSFIGLLVGGLVAMLIPRDYVAVTEVQFNRPKLDPSLGNPEDPMSQVIESARTTVPATVEEAVVNLGWPEATQGDIESRRAFIADTRSDVQVADLGPYNKKRRIAKLRIVYQDSNGYRAMNLANEIREVWLKEYVDTLKRQADSELQVTQKQIDEKKDSAREVTKRKIAFERRHQLNPQDFFGEEERGGRVLSKLTRDLDRLDDKIEDTGIRIAELQAQLKLSESLLDSIPPTVPLTQDDRFKDPAIRARWVDLQAKRSVAEKAFKNMKPAHRGYEAAELRLRSAEAEIAELEARVGGEAGEQDNPTYLERQAEIRKLRGQIVRAKTGLARLQQRRKVLSERVDGMPKILAEYDVILTRLATIDEDLLRLEDERRDKDKVRRRIMTEEPITVLAKAVLPRAPTVPNRTLVTFLGSLIGLALAVGLVLMLDFLRFNYKTVAEVERGLDLPVLGTLSHMATDAERRRQRNKRTRATVIAAVFLVLVVVLFTLHHTAPTSLPTFVREALDVIVGPAK